MMSHVVNVSSNANNGTNAGTFYVNANNDSSNANRNIGRQHAGSCNWNLTPARSHTQQLRSIFPKQLRGAV